MNLSVLMSVYDKESSAYLYRSLDSLANQTFQADEIVLVEDGPLGQELSAVIGRFQKSMLIKRVKLPVNGGLGGALQMGLTACRGEYVARMDSDDVSVPDRFHVQMDFLQNHPEVDVLGATIAEFRDDCADATRTRRMPSSGELILEFAKSRNPINHQTVVFRKASVLAVGGYQPFNGFEDYDLWARMLKVGFRLQNMNAVLVYARCGNGMQGRRGGLAYIKREVAFMFHLRNEGFLSNFQCTRNILSRTMVRFLPNFARDLFYSRFLRRRQ